MKIVAIAAIAAATSGRRHVRRTERRRTFRARGRGTGGAGGMSAYTPGPWWCDTDHVVYPSDDRGGQSWIADCRGATNPVADARLIAASPDLLAACKVALKSLAIGASPLERSNAIRDLRLAIDKAEA